MGICNKARFSNCDLLLQASRDDFLIFKRTINAEFVVCLMSPFAIITFWIVGF